MSTPTRLSTKPVHDQPKVATRRTPAGVLKEVTEWVEYLDRKIVAQSSITSQDVQELGFRVSMAEDAIQKYGEHWYELGKAEKGLFDE
jgi:hypothetical protein